jgi:hypothetical protein
MRWKLRAARRLKQVEKTPNVTTAALAGGSFDQPQGVRFHVLEG